MSLIIPKSFAINFKKRFGITFNESHQNNIPWRALQILFRKLSSLKCSGVKADKARKHRILCIHVTCLLSLSG